MVWIKITVLFGVLTGGDVQKQREMSPRLLKKRNNAPILSSQTTPRNVCCSTQQDVRLCYCKQMEMSLRPLKMSLYATFGKRQP